MKRLNQCLAVIQSIPEAIFLNRLTLDFSIRYNGIHATRHEALVHAIRYKMVWGWFRGSPLRACMGSM